MKEGKRTPFHMETPQRITASFTASQDLMVHLDITGKENELLWGVSPLWVQTLPDLDPYLEVLEPQLQSYVFPTQEIPFKANINDDYGIRSVVLVIRYQNKNVRIDWTPKGPVSKNIALNKILDLERFKLFSQDFVVAHLEVRDNYPGDPPHLVKSSLFTFVIRDYVEQFKFRNKESDMPSLRKLFEDVLSEQEKVVQDSWDYLSMSPLETPKGWEEAPEGKS